MYALFLRSFFGDGLAWFRSNRMHALAQAAQRLQQHVRNDLVGDVSSGYQPKFPWTKSRPFIEPRVDDPDFNRRPSIRLGEYSRSMSHRAREGAPDLSINMHETIGTVHWQQAGSRRTDNVDEGTHSFPSAKASTPRRRRTSDEFESWRAHPSSTAKRACACTCKATASAKRARELEAKMRGRSEED